MPIPRPILHCSFAENPGYLDPRLVPLRSGVATYMDVDGLMKTAPSNVLRWHWDPITRQSRGLIMENQRTNSFWHSRDLTQAQWAKTNATITANSANAADGTAALDLVTATGAGASVAQSATITAGHSVAVSVYARAATTGWLSIALTDGVNTVTAWFNLTAGVTGSNTAGAGTLVYGRHYLDDIGGGLYRCVLGVSSSVVTSLTALFAPCASNSVAAANTDSAHMGDFQFESASGTVVEPSSLITTAGAAGTRPAEGLTIPVANISGWNASEGTLVFEWIAQRFGGTSGMVFGGIADTFANTIYLTFDGSSIFYTAITGSVGQATIGRVYTPVLGVRARVAMRWAANNMALCLNAGVINVDVVNTVPPVTRLGIGTSPWGTTGGAAHVPYTMVALFNEALSDADLQAVTRPSPV